MSISLPSRHVFFYGSPSVRSSGSNLCFAIAAVTPSRRSSRLLPHSTILVRHACATRSRFGILRDSRAHASSLGSCEFSSSPSSTELKSSISDGFDLDSFLSFTELLCIVSSAVISVGFAVNYLIFGEIRKRVLAWGFVGLVGAVAIGSWLRRRQWRRICRGTEEGERSSLIRRMEKLEGDVRSSATIVRALSRQLEKLGIRFRVTRKALKEPISETAALVQKNSEATRVLAAQEDILEKELGEIQKVLLAMQEQQQKQLELILAVTKNGKLLENSSKQASNKQRDKANECFRNSPDGFIKRDTLKKPATGANP